MTTDEPQQPETPVDASTPSNSTSLGGRVRKTTQKFTFVAAKGDEPEEFSPPAGSGVKVRDMQFAKSNVETLGKKQQEMIKQLYNIMFGRRFQQKNMKVIKEHILDFSGVIEQDDKSREHLFDKMGKWKLIFVHEVMDLLAVDRSKKAGETNDKKALINRLIDWLYNPQETKLGEKKAAIAAKKEKQKANKRAKAKANAEKKANGEEKEPAKKKRRTSKKKADAAADEDKEEDDNEATESEGEESSSDFEGAKKKPTKKRKATRRPKKSRVVESDNEGDADENEEDAAADKDEDQPAAEPEAEAEADVAEKEESKSAAEPLAADVCVKVRDIIARGNAEELTVKKIVRQLSADLGRDMSSQKKAIKEFITNDQVEV
ncbi:hypothetical protein PRIC1_002014 [Phytophthora ramorum]